MSQEFKTLQAQTPLFADIPKMQEILAEESKAGWDLLAFGSQLCGAVQMVGKAQYTHLST